MLDGDGLDAVRMVRESAGAIAPRGGPLARVRGLRFTTPGYDPAVWRQMASLGWIGLRLPETAGGAAMGMAESVALYEELGRGLVPEPLIAASLAAAVLDAVGDEGLLAQVLAGDRQVALAWQGTADATDVAWDAPVRLFVPVADVFIVPVMAQGAPALRVIEAAAAEAEPVMQQDGTQAAAVRFGRGDGVAIPAGAVARALDEAVLGTAAYLLGVAEQAFAITLDYLKQRKQFGQALASFQALQHRAADMKIQLTLSRASIDGAAAELDAGAGPARRASVVSRAKARASDTAMLVGREAIQLHGAIGYADECDIGLYTRKAMVVANQFGSAMAHRRRFVRLGDLTS